jgi:type II secretory pathway pseudopilin PulG
VTRGANGGKSEAGSTLIELLVAMSIFVTVLGITYGTLINVQQQTNYNIGRQQVTEGGMLALNKIASQVRDVSNSYDNAYQAGDTGTADIVTMNATEMQFLSGNNIINNDASGLVDTNGGGSFGTGCANLIDIKLVSGAIVETETAPTVPSSGSTSGQCTWTATAVTVTLASNVEPLCAGAPCTAATTGATIFSYLQSYPDQTATATSASQVGEVTIGFAVLSRNSSISPVVLTETVRLAAVLADPSS